MTIRAIVGGENVHEQKDATVAALYPQGMHQTIADALTASGKISATTATLQEVNHGLSDERLQETDVLFWWGHAAHGDVEDEVVDLVQQHVWQGMGLVCLHSAHFSKIFRRMTGTPCALRWREAGEKERVWVCNPSHPIAAGLPAHFEIEQSEMYGEPFSIPEPDETVFMSWYEGGDVFRSGVTFKRGAGRIFYFGPGHEMYPIYHQAEIHRVLQNAAVWAAPTQPRWTDVDEAPNAPADLAPEPLEIKGPRLHQDGESGLR